MLLLVVVSLIAFLLFLLYWDYMHKAHRVAVFKRSGVVGPPALPLIGCGLELLSIQAENILQYIGDCHQRFGKTFRIWILNEAQVFTTDMKVFDSILTSSTLLQKGSLYDILRPWLADGLLLSSGRKWHQRRKMFTTAFHFKILENFVQIFDEQSSILVQCLEKYADGKTAFDLFPVVCLAALDVISETAMGVKVQAQLDAEFPYVKALKRVVYIQANRVLNFSQRYDWTFRLTAPGEYRKMHAAIRTMRDFTIQVIEERRAALQKSKAEGTYKPLIAAVDSIGSRPKMALLDILLQSTIDGKTLTNEDIREEVDTFMFEGDDTTTSGVSHALYSIARHPEVQHKLVEEIYRIMGKDKSAPIDMEQLQQLKYMECVIKETMRLYPPVPGFGRKTHADIELDNGITIPANTSVYMVPYYAHRDPDVFPDPESFKPERFENFDGKDELRKNAFAYVPFSAGPRNCIGQKFAMLEIKTIIAKVLRYYELLPLGPSLAPLFNFVLRSQNGMHIGLRRRV